MDKSKNISVDQPCASSSMGEEEQVINDSMNCTASWMTPVKRRKMSFVRQTNVIAKNDIIVNDNLNKIKIEEDIQNTVEFKEEDIQNTVEFKEEDIQNTVEFKEEVDSVAGDSMQFDENMIAKFKLIPCRVRLERVQLPDFCFPGISTGSSDETLSNEADGSEEEQVQPDSGNISQRDPVSSSRKGDETQDAEYKRENDQLKARNEELVMLLNEKNLENSLLREKISQLEFRPVGSTVKSGIRLNDDGSLGPGAAASSSEGYHGCQSSNGKTANDDLLVTSHATAPENTQNELAKRVSALEDDCRMLKNLIAKNMEASKTKLTSEEIVTDSVNNVIPQQEEEDEQTENTKVVEIFYQVLPVLIQKRRPLGKTKWADQMEMLKTMRLVCKTWKESVDRVLKNDPVHLILCSDSFLLQFKKNFTPCSTIIMNNDIAKTNLGRFLGSVKKNMDEYPTFNPLLTGHLVIDVDAAFTPGNVFFTEEWNKFAERIVDLLMIMGNRVLYLTLGLKGTSYLTSALEKPLGDLLMKWLHLTPNLKSLCMEFVEFRIKSNQKYYKVSLDQVPHLKYLETIQNSGGIVLHQLLKRNQQVSRLYLGGSTFCLSKIFDMKLQNLAEVGLLFGNCHLVVVASRWFQKLNSVRWQPRGLTLIFPANLAHSPRGDVRFLSPHLKNKLDHISLELVTGQIPSSSQVEWDLPLSLKQMRIKWRTDAWFPINLEKLLNKVKLLETLELEMGVGDRNIKKMKRLGIDTSDNGKEERMQGFWQFVSALGTANYWKHFPKIRSVKIKLVIKEGEPMTIQQRDIVRSGMSTIGFQCINIGNEAYYNGF